MKPSNESSAKDASIFAKALTRSHDGKGKSSKVSLRAVRVAHAMLALIMSLCLPMTFQSSALSGQDPIDRPKAPGKTGKKPPSKQPTTEQPSTKARESGMDSRAKAEVLKALANSFVEIPAGEFLMGSENGRSDEMPVHRVRISRAFQMGKYEVTQAQWQAVMGNNPSKFRGPNLPVENVSWNDAQQFIQKLNARNDGYTYRLPTEAEWEYACRAGTTTEFAFGNGLSSAQANFDGNFPYGNAPKGKYLERTAAVGSYKPNAWGLYDMHGNVWEWCQDWHSENYYAQSPNVDPQGPASGSNRLARGGSWVNGAAYLRSASRGRNTSDFAFYNVGFRLARIRR